MADIEHYVGTTTLVVTTCWCGVPHAIPKSLYDLQRRQFDNGETVTGVYCPSGHSHIPAGTGKAVRLEKELMQERQRLDQVSAALRSAEADKAKMQAEAKRLKKRASNGVCPCCHRTVKQLAAHMKTKHPEYK